MIDFQDCYASLVADLRKQSIVLGLILGGSRGRGLGNEDSDTDLFIIFEAKTSDARMAQTRDRIYSKYNGRLKLDLGKHALQPIVNFKEFARYGTPSMPERYSLVNVRLEFDQSKGLVTEILRNKQTLDRNEADIGMAMFFPDYLNKAYRSVSSALHGNPRGSLLDAATSIDFLLGSLFTLHHRVVPFNKFLEFELTTNPLPSIKTRELLKHLQRIMNSGSVESQKRLYQVIAALARERSYTHMIDAWHGKLAVLESVDQMR